MRSSAGAFISASMRLLLRSARSESAKTRFFLRRRFGRLLRNAFCGFVFWLLRRVALDRRFGSRSGLRSLLSRRLLVEFRDENFVDEFLRRIGRHRAPAIIWRIMASVGKVCASS